MQHLVGYLLLTGVMNMQEIGYSFPETSQCLGKLIQHAHVFLTFGLVHEFLITSLAAVLCQYFIGDAVIIGQIGIFPLDLVPNVSCAFHQLDNILPLVRILLAKGFCP